MGGLLHQEGTGQAATEVQANAMPPPRIQGADAGAMRPADLQPSKGGACGAPMSTEQLTSYL
eukprot:5045876-Pleurochrysis_carterae.AAC.4